MNRCPLVFSLLLVLSPAAFSLVSGEHVTGSISPVGDVDSYTFAASIGENVRIGLGETAGVTFTPSLSVQAPGGGVVATDSDFNGAFVAFQATESGTYTIFVSESGNDSTGSYDLNLAVLPRSFSTSGDNGSLINGLEQSGTTSLGDHDLWSFTAQRGDAIRIGVGETSGPVYTPFFELFDPNGQRIGFDSDPAGASVSTTANLDGTYVVVVSDSGKDDTGTYEISLAVVPQSYDTSGDNGTLVNGLEQVGSIDVADFDIWKFSAERGDAIRLGMGETGGNVFTPFLQLFDPDGRLVASDSDSVGAAVFVTAAQAGDYIAVVSDSGQDDSGSYELSLAVVSQAFDTSGDNGTLTNGLEQTGSIDLADFDLWNFEVEQGDLIHLGVGELTGSVFTPRIELFDPSGRLVTTDSDSDSAFVTVTAAAAGEYTAVIMDSGSDDTGTYEISLAVVPATFNVSNDNGILVNGLEQTGSIDLGDFDLWTFEAERGDAIRLGIGEVSGSVFTPFLKLVDPNGATIATASSSSGTGVSVRAAVDGTYTAVVSDSGKDDTGTYTLSLALLPYAFDTSGDNGILTNGVTANGSIDLGDYDIWVLSANVGDTLNLTFDEVTGSTFSPFLELVSPDGSLLASDGDSSSASISYYVPVSGVYYLVVSDSGRDDTGTYDLTASGFTGVKPVFSVATPELELNPAENGELELVWQAVSGWTLETSEGDLSSWQPLEGGVIDGTQRKLGIQPSGKAFFRLNDAP